MFKYFLSTISLLVVVFMVFLFWGSSGWMNQEDYFRVKVLNDQFKTYQPGDTLTVTTFNLGYFSGMTNNLPVERDQNLFDNNQQKAIELFQNNPSDFIGFQEIDYQSKRSGYVNQSGTLQKALDFPNTYESVNWDKQYVPFPYWPLTRQFGKMSSGQALFSKFKILNADTKVLQKPINAPFYYNKFYLDRQIQIVQVQLGNDTLCLMNLHLEAFDKETRVLQANVVDSLFKVYSELWPTLIIGDFNSVPDYVDSTDAMSKILTIEHIGSAISQKQYSQSTHLHFTFNSSKPDRMIDYILYDQRKITPVSAKVLRDAGEISDHFPVRMKFVINH